MSGYEPYPQTSASSDPWLDSLPSHRNTVRLSKLSTKITNGYVGPTRGLFVEDGVPYLQSLHIKQNSVRFTPTYFVPDGWSNSHAKSILREEDVLVVQTGDVGQVACVPPELVGANCHALIVISPVLERVLGRFLSLCLSSGYGSSVLKSIQTGALHPHLNCGTVRDVAIPLPPLEEQCQIARFLDYETAKIDALIEKQQQLIALLKEKRQAVISHAVTKGLDPQSKLKDSGVEWLGKVPAHWAVAKLARFIRVGSGEFLPNSDFAFNETKERCVPVVGGNGVSGWGTKANSPSGTLVIGRVGALCGNVHLLKRRSWVTDNALRVDFSDRFEADYLAEILRVRNLNDLADKSAQPLITGGRIKTQSIPVPPSDEQMEIGEYIRKKVPLYDALEGHASAAVDLLQERRTALISAAVTGKIDVRAWQPPEGKTTQEIA